MKKLVFALALIGLSSSSAFANSYKTECRLVGAHLTPTVMMTIASDESTNEQKFAEREMDGDNALDAKSSQLGFEKDARKGDTDVLVSKASKTTYKIVALEDTQDLGTWQSKPVEDQCAPYGDFNTRTTQLEITMTKGSKVVAKKKALMVCEGQGGYHGYYGQKGCEIDEK